MQAREGSTSDVVVIGGGIAGMAACIHLARAGMNVVCLEGATASGDAVGESLDWSAPDLLSVLGLPASELIERGIATSKKHVILRLLDGSEGHYEPGEWLARSPYNVNLDTLHVDRSALDAAVRGIAIECGVSLISDRVTRVESTERKVHYVETASGVLHSAKWFVDASGSGARVLARAFDLHAREYGPAKVAVWKHFSTDQWVEGTTLYGSYAAPDGYMDWVWQIPIKPGVVSVGCVFTGEAVKQKRRAGMELSEIYDARLAEFPALAPLLEDVDAPEPRVTSFRCRVHDVTSGPNWLVIGEAAAMVDPMTSNGVTAALRHASEAAHLILRSRNLPRLPRLATTAYNWRVRGQAKFFNSGIERIMYQRAIRSKIGPLIAGDTYTIPAWLMNLFYARLQPRNIVTTACFGSMWISLRSIAAACSWLCGLSGWQAPVTEGSAS